MSGSLDAGLRLVLAGAVPNANLARQALEASGVRTTQVVLALRVADGAAFAQTILSLVPAKVFQDRERQAAGSALKAVWDELAARSVDAGQAAMQETRFSSVVFGKAAATPAVASEAALAKGRAVATEEALRLPNGLGVRLVRVGKRIQVTSDEANETLTDYESRKKNYWALRLEDFRSQAGDASGWEAMFALHPVEISRELIWRILRRGAWRTIMQHARMWLTIASFANEFCTVTGPGRDDAVRRLLYPPQRELVVAMLVRRAATGCAPTVPDSIVYTTRWICGRFSMTVPDLCGQDVRAIREDVMALRSKELREAPDLPVELVYWFERLILYVCPTMKLVIWWFLLLIWGTLRADDAIHVVPSSLRLREDALLGSSWQTKVDRKRRGTGFACVRAGLSGVDWCGIGFFLLALELPWTITDGKCDRDFLLYRPVGEGEQWTWDTVFLDYTTALPLFRQLLMQAVDLMQSESVCEPDHVYELLKAAEVATLHGCKNFIINLSVHHGSDERAVGEQGHWKPGPNQVKMQVKYTRHRQELPINMVTELSEDLRAGWRPASHQVLYGGDGCPVGADLASTLAAESLTSSAPEELARSAVSEQPLVPFDDSMADWERCDCRDWLEPATIADESSWFGTHQDDSVRSRERRYDRCDPLPLFNKLDADDTAEISDVEDAGSSDGAAPPWGDRTPPAKVRRMGSEPPDDDQVSESAGGFEEPALPPDEEPGSEDEDAGEEVNFYALPAALTPAGCGVVRIHAVSLVDARLVACNRHGMLTEDLEPVGDDVPDAGSICGSCLRSRPDLRARFFPRSYTKGQAVQLSR